MRRGILQINNMWGGEVPEALLKRAVRLTLAEEAPGEPGEVSLALVPAELMRQLNVRYRGRDAPTDVLAFSLQGEVGPAQRILGEVVICPDVARTQVKEAGHSLEEELVLLTVHGMLHLLGYTDEEGEEKKLMEDKTRKILKLLGKREDIVGEGTG